MVQEMLTIADKRNVVFIYPLSLALLDSSPGVRASDLCDHLVDKQFINPFVITKPWQKKRRVERLGFISWIF